MIPLVLATALDCQSAQDIIQGIQRNRALDSEDKISLVEIIKVNSEGCWDANAD